jgi:hypothetical protein
MACSCKEICSNCLKWKQTAQKRWGVCSHFSPKGSQPVRITKGTYQYDDSDSVLTRDDSACRAFEMNPNALKKK